MESNPHERRKRFDGKKRIAARCKVPQTRLRLQQNPRKHGFYELDKQGESVMKYLVGSIVTSLLLSILALSSVAQGQRSEQIIQANIPFDFAVGSRFYPAGHYSLVRSQPWQLELRDSEGRTLVNLLTQSVQTSTAPDRPKLVFSTEDRRHVLTQVWQENDAIGQQILQSKWGNDAVRKHSGDVQTAKAGSPR